MLAEIARKREDLEQARAEEQRRATEAESNSAHQHYSVGP
jgi:F0F1-type ATP synthase epsilon subunit